MSDGEALHTVLSSPKNYGQQKVILPKLQILTKEKPSTISQDEDSNKTSPTILKPATPGIPSPNESPISDEPNSGSEDLHMSPELAQAFDDVAQLPGTSFLKEPPRPRSNTTCTFILLHSALKLSKTNHFITRTRPLYIDQLIDADNDRSFRPKWRITVNKHIQRIIDRIANELGSEPAIITELQKLSNTTNSFFEPCIDDSGTVYPISFEDLFDILIAYNDTSRPLEIKIMLDDQASRLFGTIVRNGLREISTIRSSSSSRRTDAKSTKSPVAEVIVPETTAQNTEEDELTHHTSEDENPSNAPKKETEYHDPPWDSHDRHNFTYRGGRNHVYQQRKRIAGYPEPKSESNSSRHHASQNDNNKDPSDPSIEPHQSSSSENSIGPFPEGPHWTHFVINPYEDIIADPTTGSIQPWYAIKHEMGRTLNFPLNLGNLQIDKDLFLAQFIDTRYDANTHFKSFMYRFPQFPEEDGPGFRHHIIPFLYQVTQHCVAFSVYVPPPHTLRPGDKLGVWHDELPIWTQRQIPSTFNNLLAQAFRQKSTNLSTHKRLSAFVRTPKQGYDVIMALAIEAGHPSLQQFPETPKEPRQNADTSIVKYIDNWSQYLQRMVLTGHHYNDRFFYQQLFRNSHINFKNIFNELRLAVHEQNHQRPLPPSFHMSSLLTKITQLAHFIDSRVDVNISPRDLQRNYKPQTPPLKVAQTTQSSEFSTSKPMTCYLCGEEHPLYKCPELNKVLTNEKGKSALKRILDAQQLLIRQLQHTVDESVHDQDEECTPTTVNDDDQGYDTPDEQPAESDFRHAG